MGSAVLAGCAKQKRHPESRAAFKFLEWGEGLGLFVIRCVVRGSLWRIVIAKVIHAGSADIVKQFLDFKLSCCFFFCCEILD